MINFLKYKWVYFTVSAIVILSGLVSIGRWGYRMSIDFTGGTNLEYLFNKTVDNKKLSAIIRYSGLQVIDEKLQNGNHLILKTKAIDEKQETNLKSNLIGNLKVAITVLKSETVGPTLGSETMTKTIIASLLAIAGILIYMSFAFKGFDYAVSAILAMIHDFLVVMGTYSLISHFFGAELDTMFVTAVLTAMSFSVHDTIIIFDKIREYFREEGYGNMEFYANRALTETLVRSLNNSMTIIFMLLALSLMGGETIRFFVIALLVGTITGTYSSPFIATPILVFLEKKRLRKTK